MSDFDYHQPIEIESEKELLKHSEEVKFGSQLRDAEVGNRVVRGGMIRVFGYGLGSLAIAVSSIFLLRYLGVSDFGKYAAVMSLIAIVAGVTDAGLNTVGNRELALAETVEDRRRIVGMLSGVRLVLTPLGVLAAIAYTLLAGYESELVLGTAVAGLGVTLMSTSATLTLVLAVDLRIVRLTILDVIKQVTPTVLILALVAVGASLLPFFATAIPGAIAAIVLTPVLAGRHSVAPPSFNFRAWKPLLIKALPVAIGTTIAVLYLRILTVLMYELTNDFETGLFSTSVRVVELIVAVPWIVFGVVLPVLSVANSEDRVRTAYVFQRMIDVGLLAATLIAVALCLAAQPIIDVIGGAEYDGAVPVLQIQAFAIIGAFVAQACMYAAVAMELLTEVMIANAIGLVTVIAIGIPLIDQAQAQGAAVAALIAELVTAIAYLVLVSRASPETRPSLRHAWKPALAGGAAIGAALLSGTPAVAQTFIAIVVSTLIAVATRAVPSEVFDALRRRTA